MPRRTPIPPDRIRGYTMVLSASQRSYLMGGGKGTLGPILSAKSPAGAAPMKTANEAKDPIHDSSDSDLCGS